MDDTVDFTPLQNLPASRFERADILKRLALASRRLAEFKGVAASVPNQRILLNTLSLQEAKDSSAIENIVTTHDALFRSAASLDNAFHPAAKEVLRYAKALSVGWARVRESHLLTSNYLADVQASLEPGKPGIRNLPGTTLKDNKDHVVYTPPQDHAVIRRLLDDLERFINDDPLFDADPLIKMALIHHRFESIHPFWDGNGRTGRIANVLYLVKQGLLDIPVLYLSRYIVRTKAEYYARLQAVRDADEWEDWVLYILAGVEQTAADGIDTVRAMHRLLLDTKKRIRGRYAFYSQDLINNLFSHPYTKISFIEHDLKVSRITAAKYLDQLVGGGFLAKHRIGRSNYYINLSLFELLAGANMREGAQ